MEVLYLIPARGGSKGIKGKNIKIFQNKPLIVHTIEAARGITTDENICVSSDNAEIILEAEKTGLSVPFIRPAELALDGSGSYEVIEHALTHYKRIKREFDAVMLLQPTSPFRKSKHMQEALNLFNESIDMVMSVKIVENDPYRLLFKESADGNLEKLFANEYIQRQDAPVLYEENGAIYLMNAKSIDAYTSFNEFKKKQKYVMDAIPSLDIDTEMDWKYAEYIAEKKLNH